MSTDLINLKFEVVEFYPESKKKGQIKGSMHVYVPAWDMDIRGIRCMAIKKEKGDKPHYIFRLPEKKALDENGNIVRFPIISWTNPDMQKRFYAFLQSEGIAYIKKKLKEGLAFPKITIKQKLAEIDKEKAEKRRKQLATA